MIEHEFQGVFLNASGSERYKQGLDTEGSDWNDIKPVSIDLLSFESYYENDTRYNGDPVCTLRTKSGDEWTVKCSYDYIKNLRKNIFALKVN